MNKELEEAKKQIRTARKLVTFFVGVLGVLLFAIIALVIWAIIQSRQVPVSFAECVTYKDAKILESYPEQCVVKGKSFTNPDQKVLVTETQKEEVSSDAWLVYVPDDNAYTVKLIDGWGFESYAVGKKEVLTACVKADTCVYKNDDPARLVNRTGKVDSAASLQITYGEEPVLAATYLAAGEVELKNGGTAKKYAYNDGAKTTYIYVVNDAETTVTATYVVTNNATENLQYIEEMVSTITLQ